MTTRHVAGSTTGDAASPLLRPGLAVREKRARPVRSVVGVAALPYDMPMEIEAEVRVAQ
jgi:enamine deaminase RidA (YjgF/YER057c/UK114 family)